MHGGRRRKNCISSSVMSDTVKHMCMSFIQHCIATYQNGIAYASTKATFQSLPGISWLRYLKRIYSSGSSFHWTTEKQTERTKKGKGTANRTTTLENLAFSKQKEMSRPAPSTCNHRRGKGPAGMTKNLGLEHTSHVKSLHVSRDFFSWD